MKFSTAEIEAENRAEMIRRIAAVRHKGDEESLSALMRFADSYQRLPLLLDSYPYVSPEVFYRRLGQEWSGFDNVSAHKSRLLQVFKRATGEDRKRMMDDTEYEAFAALPEVLTVWRGCYTINRDGLSWSLDRGVAERFTSLLRYQRPGDTPILLCARVRKSGTVLKLGRDEQEVIIPRRVRGALGSLPC